LPQPEVAYALPVLPPVVELPDAAQVSALDEQLRAAQVPAYSAAPRTGVHCARAAQRVLFLDGSAPVAVSRVPALDALALPPDDSVLAVPQAVAHSARAVQPALAVQRDGSVALPPDDSPQDELAQVVMPDDSVAQPEQRAAR
jgi:hypothetical protein